VTRLKTGTDLHDWRVRVRYRALTPTSLTERLDQARWLEGTAVPGRARTAVLVVSDGLLLTVGVRAAHREGALRAAAVLITDLVGEPDRVLGLAVAARVYRMP